MISAADPQSAIRTEDYLHVKGVRLVEPGMPQWKIKPLQEKNIELINKYLVSVGLGWQPLQSFIHDTRNIITIFWMHGLFDDIALCMMLPQELRCLLSSDFFPKNRSLLHWCLAILSLCITGTIHICCHTWELLILTGGYKGLVWGIITLYLLKIKLILMYIYIVKVVLSQHFISALRFPEWSILLTNTFGSMTFAPIHENS